MEPLLPARARVSALVQGPAQARGPAQLPAAPLRQVEALRFVRMRSSTWRLSPPTRSPWLPLRRAFELPFGERYSRFPPHLAEPFVTRIPHYSLNL